MSSRNVKDLLNQESNLLSMDDIGEFVLERFEEIKVNPKMKNIVKFHTINKYLLMTLSPNDLNKLGNIVANRDEKQIFEIISDYESILRTTLEKTPTIKSHSNTLYHIFGHFSKELTDKEKSSFLVMLEDFRESKISLSKILVYMKNYVAKFDKAYLIRQTYFLFHVNSKFSWET